jgi:hypothetical protein
LNFDGGRPEYYGKFFCKDHATRTQRRQISLAKQTAQRYFENSVVVEAERVLAHSKALTYKDMTQYQCIPTVENDSVESIQAGDGVQLECHVLQSKLCQLSINPDDAENLVFEWSNKTHSTTPGYNYEPIVYRTLAKRIWFSRNGGRLSKDGGVLQCFSECILPDKSIVRAHPLYNNSERPWHDWVLVQWEDDGDYLPAQVKLLFQISSGEIENFNEVGESKVHHNNEFLELGKGYALVRTVTGDEFRYHCRDPNRRCHFKSSIASRYTMESHMRLESIESLAFVINNDVGSLGNKEDNEEQEEVIIMFHDRSTWKEKFLSL